MKRLIPQCTSLHTTYNNDTTITIKTPKIGVTLYDTGVRLLCFVGYTAMLYHPLLLY